METLELKNTIAKANNALDGFKSKMERTEKRITELEDRKIEITQFEQQRERVDKRKKKKQTWPHRPVGL